MLVQFYSYWFYSKVTEAEWLTLEVKTDAVWATLYIVNDNETAPFHHWHEAEIHCDSRNEEEVGRFVEKYFSSIGKVIKAPEGLRIKEPQIATREYLMEGQLWDVDVNVEELLLHHWFKIREWTKARMELQCK